MVKLFLVLFLTAILSACSTSKSFSPYGELYPPTSVPVQIYSQGEAVPSSCIRIGELHIYDATLATQCGYNDVLEQAKSETNSHGGNAFVITRVSTPSVWTSTCYRIRGEILLCK